MWIFTKIGFFSIVQHRDDRDQFLVRSRTRDDLVRLVDSISIKRDRIRETGTDYPFRVFITRDEMVTLAQELVAELNYPNFKAEVGRRDPSRASLYSRVWALLGDHLGWARQQVR